MSIPPGLSSAFCGIREETQRIHAFDYIDAHDEAKLTEMRSKIVVEPSPTDGVRRDSQVLRVILRDARITRHLDARPKDLALDLLARTSWQTTRSSS